MKNYNSLFCNVERQAIGFSKIGTDGFIAIKNKSVLRKRIKEAAEALGINQHDLHDRLLKGETFNWPIISKSVERQ